MQEQSRRTFVKLFGLGTASLMCSSYGLAAENRPNILVILADDMGFSDLGCYGGEIHTPNLDNLAHNGLRFTQFYNAARCCPTRASLLTGLYPHQAGVGAMDSDKGTPPYQGYLNDRSVTISEMLKASGYSTYMSGKWHVGRKKGHWPLDRGFDRYFGLINGASNFFNNIYYRDPSEKQTILLDNERYKVEPTTEEMWKKNEGFYMTDAFTDYAIQFLDEHKQSSNPFFLYLPYTAPHWPLHAFPEDIDRYRGRYSSGWDELRQQRYRKQIELGLIDETVQLAPLDNKVVPWDQASQEAKEEFELEMALYAAMIDRMDRNIGKVMKKLKEMGQFDNTLILFLSDNGGCHTTPSFSHLQGTPGGPNSFPCYGYMGAELSNVPFRKYKQYIHEGGIATPFIVHFPNLIQNGGKIVKQPGHIIDIMPTIADLTGSTYPEKRNGKEVKPLQGISLKPALKGKSLNRKEPLFWEHVGNRGVRIGNWKLVAAKPDLKWELFNLKEDRTELNDLSEKHLERKKEMVEIYEQWAAANGIKPFKK